MGKTSQLELLCREAVLKNFLNLTGKQLRWRPNFNEVPNLDLVYHGFRTCAMFGMV